MLVNKRSEILRHAVRLFIRRGRENVNGRDIAAACGVVQSTLSSHFDKPVLHKITATLLAEAWALAWAGLQDGLERMMTESERQDPLLRLRFILRSFVVLYKKQDQYERDLFVFLLIYRDPAGKHSVPQAISFFEKLEAIYATGTADGGPLDPSTPPAAFSHAVTGAFVDLMYRHHLGREGVLDAARYTEEDVFRCIGRIVGGFRAACKPAWGDNPDAEL